MSASPPRDAGTGTKAEISLRTPIRGNLYQLEQLKKQAEENQQKLEEMIKNIKFRANGEVNGKPAYYNPVTRQSLTADSDGKYKLRDW